MSAKIDEFKGHKIIKLMRDEDDKYGFAFGLGKARLIISHIKEIQKFIDDNENEN